MKTLTVGELVKKLQELDQGKEVIFTVQDNEYRASEFKFSDIKDRFNSDEYPVEIDVSYVGSTLERAIWE